MSARLKLHRESQTVEKVLLERAEHAESMAEALRTELSGVRLALQTCDTDVADHCATIVALAHAAKSHLALTPSAILSVAQLFDVIVEKAQYLTDSIDGIASDQGVSNAKERDHTLANEIYRQYRELRAAGPVLLPAGDKA